MGNEGSACCSPANVTTKDSDDIYGKHRKSEEADHYSTGGHLACEGNVTEAEDQKRMTNVQKGGRRQAIAAESVNVQDAVNYIKPVYQKAPATQEKIKNVIRDDSKMQVLFGHLDANSLQDIVNAFQEVEVPRGQRLMTQGDIGDALYIIKDGEVDVFVARPGLDGKAVAGNGSKVATLGAGKLFGELALMYSAPRAATVEVASPMCQLWQLDREPFKMLLAQKSQLQYAQYEDWLTQVDILKSLNHYELSRLSEALEPDVFDAGDVIITQGEAGDRLFILEEGSCAAFIAGSAGEKLVMEYTRKGDYFGEIALLTDAPRKATVRAMDGGCSVLSMSKEDFTAILGPIQDFLRKDIEKYPKYREFIQG